jgi:hypothetical protein
MKILWTKRAFVLTLLMCSLMVLAAGSSRVDNGKLTADLDGFQEVPSISTTGNGEFEARIDDAAQTIEYKLSFGDLEGPALVAHIHFAQRGVAGPVMIDLCGATKPACPAAGGTVMGTIVPADVKALLAQGIEAGNFVEAVRAIRSGNTYANVHTTRFPGGEIRGQIKARRHGDDDDNE